MSEINEAVNTGTEELEAIMPVGWTDGSDIFDPKTWGSDATADAQGDSTEAFGENGAEDLESLFRAIGQAKEEEEETATDESTEEVPATDEPEVPAPSNKLRFQAKVDHEARDVELNPEDLPSIYEQSQALPRYKERLRAAEAELAEWDSVAKQLKYDDRKAFRTGVIENAVQNYLEEHPNVPEDMARDYLMGRFNAAVKQESPAVDQPTEPEPAQVTAPPAPARDFKSEVAELFSRFPEARNAALPDEVTVAAVTQNKPLIQAYSEYAARKATADANAVRQENKILKQNQASAAKAPVSGVSRGGGTDNRPEDPFLKGFNEDTW